MLVLALLLSNHETKTSTFVHHASDRRDSPPHVPPSLGYGWQGCPEKMRTFYLSGGVYVYDYLGVLKLGVRVLSLELARVLGNQVLCLVC